MLAGERERVRTQRMVQQNAKSDGPGDQEGFGAYMDNSQNYVFLHPTF